MSKVASTTGQRVFTGVAAVLILALALWLLLGRSPGAPPGRVEVALGTPVSTDAGTVTVSSLGPVAPGTRGVPAAKPRHRVEGIRFRACRSAGQEIALSLFSVRTSTGATLPADGSLENRAKGSCIGGLVFVQVPDGATPANVEYSATPFAVWRVPGS